MTVNAHFLLTNNFNVLILFCATQHKEIIVLHQYFQQKDVHPFFNYMERPVKEIMELNARTMQRFAYLMPAEMLMVKKPEQMMEKNIELLMESSQTALNYMQNIFGIM